LKRKDGINHYIQTYEQDPLEFFLIALISHSESHQKKTNEDLEYKLHEPSELFAMLEDHLANTAKSKQKAEVARLDELLYVSYSELSALH
jgi:hypothetical protein